MNISAAGGNDTLNYFVTSLKKEDNQVSNQGDNDDYRNPGDFNDGSKGATGHYYANDNMARSDLKMQAKRNSKP